ncbi:hypothetical protein [Nocardiopsis lucentensis]|uniref:hypothetical protein n=1 Tax=Nocardiopsis lucentensis TaxID=53441 RepID=UPI000349C600|nr:hypothetical protein [Nocardiopsis lucentensis]
MPTYDDRLGVDPEELSRAGEELREPSRLLRESFARLRSQREALGPLWGAGTDETTESVRANLTPMLDLLDEFGATLVEAFEQTADGVIRSARNYGNAEEFAVEEVGGLTPGGAGGSGRR